MINGKHRKEHLRELFVRMEKVSAQVQEYKEFYQVWAIVYEKESYYDSIFVHTPNPNKDNFPYCFDDVKWSEEIPMFLESVIDREKYRISQSIKDIYGDDYIYYVCLRSWT